MEMNDCEQTGNCFGILDEVKSGKLLADRYETLVDLFRPVTSFISRPRYDAFWEFCSMES